MLHISLVSLTDAGNEEYYESIVDNKLNILASENQLIHAITKTKEYLKYKIKLENGETQWKVVELTK